MKQYYMLLLLGLLLLPISYAEMQVLNNNITISIASNGNSSFNFSIRTQGGTSIDYFNQPITTTLNEQKTVYFIGDMNCNNTVTTMMWKQCIDFFNESCDGFLCPEAYTTCKEKLNVSSIELGKYKNNETEVGMVLGNLTLCQNEKLAYSSQQQTCMVTQTEWKDKYAALYKNVWMYVAAAAIAVFVGWYIFYTQKKSTKGPGSQSYGTRIDSNREKEPINPKHLED